MKHLVNPAAILAEPGIQSNKGSLPATRYLTGCRVKPGMTEKERQYPTVIPAEAGIQSVYLSRSDTLS